MVKTSVVFLTSLRVRFLLIQLIEKRRKVKRLNNSRHRFIPLKTFVFQNEIKIKPSQRVFVLVLIARRNLEFGPVARNIFRRFFFNNFSRSSFNTFFILWWIFVVNFGANNILDFFDAFFSFLCSSPRFALHSSDLK